MRELLKHSYHFADIALDGYEMGSDCLFWECPPFQFQQIRNDIIGKPILYDSSGVPCNDRIGWNRFGDDGITCDDGPIANVDS
jgi:hypothetical protein